MLSSDAMPRKIFKGVRKLKPKILSRNLGNAKPNNITKEEVSDGNTVNANNNCMNGKTSEENTVHESHDFQTKHQEKTSVENNVEKSPSLTTAIINSEDNALNDTQSQGNELSNLQAHGVELKNSDADVSQERASNNTTSNGEGLDDQTDPSTESTGIESNHNAVNTTLDQLNSEELVPAKPIEKKSSDEKDVSKSSKVVNSMSQIKKPYSKFKPTIAKLTKENLTLLSKETNMDEDVESMGNDEIMSVTSHDTTKENILYKERKRKFQSKMSGGVFNKDSMTMSDLIFYNPADNPMPRPLHPVSKPKKRRTNTDNDDAESVVDNPDDPHNGTNSEGEGERESSGTDAPAVEEDEEEDILAPQLKIGPDGKLIIDQASLVVQQSVDEKRVKALAQEAVDLTSLQSRRFSKKRRRALDWTMNETAHFYKALSTVGTDFSLMKEMFFKSSNRSRMDLKIKFKKEEKLSKGLIEFALNDSSQYDLTAFDEEETEFDAVADRAHQRKASQEKIRRKKEQERLEAKKEKTEERLRKKEQKKIEKARKKVLRAADRPPKKKRGRPKKEKVVAFESAASDTVVDKPEDSTNGKPEDSTKDKPEDSTKDKPEDSTKDKPEDSTKDKPEDSNKDKPEDSTKDKPEDSTVAVPVRRSSRARKVRKIEDYSFDPSDVEDLVDSSDDGEYLVEKDIENSRRPRKRRGKDISSCLTNAEPPKQLLEDPSKEPEKNKTTNQSFIENETNISMLSGIDGVEVSALLADANCGLRGVDLNDIALDNDADASHFKEPSLAVQPPSAMLNEQSSIIRKETPSFMAEEPTPANPKEHISSTLNKLLPDNTEEPPVTTKKNTSTAPEKGSSAEPKEPSKQPSSAKRGPKKFKPVVHKKKTAPRKQRRCRVIESDSSEEESPGLQDTEHLKVLEDSGQTIKLELQGIRMDHLTMSHPPKLSDIKQLYKNNKLSKSEVGIESTAHHTPSPRKSPAKSIGVLPSLKKDHEERSSDHGSSRCFSRASDVCATSPGGHCDSDLEVNCLSTDAVATSLNCVDRTLWGSQSEIVAKSRDPASVGAPATDLCPSLESEKVEETNPMSMTGSPTNPMSMTGSQETNPRSMTGSQEPNPMSMTGSPTNPMSMTGSPTNPMSMTGSPTNPMSMTGSPTNPMSMTGSPIRSASVEVQELSPPRCDKLTPPDHIFNQQPIIFTPTESATVGTSLPETADHIVSFKEVVEEKKNTSRKRLGKRFKPCVKKAFVRQFEHVSSDDIRRDIKPIEKCEINSPIRNISAIDGASELALPSTSKLSPIKESEQNISIDVSSVQSRLGNLEPLSSRMKENPTFASISPISRTNLSPVKSCTILYKNLVQSSPNSSQKGDQKPSELIDTSSCSIDAEVCDPAECTIVDIKFSSLNQDEDPDITPLLTKYPSRRSSASISAHSHDEEVQCIIQSSPQSSLQSSFNRSNSVTLRSVDQSVPSNRMDRDNNFPFSGSPYKNSLQRPQYESMHRMRQVNNLHQLEFQRSTWNDRQSFPAYSTVNPTYSTVNPTYSTVNCKNQSPISILVDSRPASANYASPRPNSCNSAIIIDSRPNSVIDCQQSSRPNSVVIDSTQIVGPNVGLVASNSTEPEILVVAATNSAHSSHQSYYPLNSILEPHPHHPVTVIHQPHPSSGEKRRPYSALSLHTPPVHQIPRNRAASLSCGSSAVVPQTVGEIGKIMHIKSERNSPYSPFSTQCHSNSSNAHSFSPPISPMQYIFKRSEMLVNEFGQKIVKVPRNNSRKFSSLVVPTDLLPPTATGVRVLKQFVVQGTKRGWDYQIQPYYL